MHRKHFLFALAPLALSFKSVAAGSVAAKKEQTIKVPAYLQPGDSIGITSPAGSISLEGIAPAVAQMKAWGFDIVIGNTVGKKDFTFGGTDAERLADLQQMLDNPKIKAIMCARGGYGLVRIIDQLNFKSFRKYPKWIIGFSDITVLHSHINRQCRIATIHSKMCNSFPDNPETADSEQQATISSIRQCLLGEEMLYTAATNKYNRNGVATGELVGGNLRTLETLSGTASDISTRNKILFVEDTGEYLYSIDRMFWNLERSGKLAHLKGLLVGGFKIKKESNEEDSFGKQLEEIVIEKVSKYNYPVCFDFPVGHQKNNYALRCGLMHQLHVSDDAVWLKNAP